MNSEKCKPSDTIDQHFDCLHRIVDGSQGRDSKVMLLMIILQFVSQMQSGADVYDWFNKSKMFLTAKFIVLEARSSNNGGTM